MGLLRRAANAVTGDDMKPSMPAAQSRRRAEPAARSGLLKKSLKALAESTVSPASTASDGLAAPAAPLGSAARVAPAATVASAASKASAKAAASAPVTGNLSRLIIEDARALSDGVELPSRLFTTLRKRLSITKGALLLYDAVRLEYAPWASFGFDQTTLHRMRIPLGANETFNALANGEPLNVTDPGQRAAFQPFFSSREFSNLEHMILSPYIFEDALVGVLVVTEIRHPFSRPEELLSCLKTVAGDVAPLLQRARGFLMKWNQARANRAPTTPEDQVARILGSPALRGKRLLFLSLALAPYIRAIAEENEDLDLFRLREDVRSLLDAFLADLGEAIMLPAGALLVSLQGLQRDEVPLFIHQLRYFLDSRFAATRAEEPSSLIQVLKSRMWPDEGSDVRELVSFLSS